MKKKINIATILPYKENYTFSEASAASLWVSEFYAKSKFKLNNYIFGSTSGIDYLTDNYINVELDSIKSKFSSKTNLYCKKISNIISKKKFDLIEVHNRPLILKKLSNLLNNKFIFYFHNDPLSMNGSRTISERIDILNKTSRIVFVSKWVQNRFFFNLDPKLRKQTDVVYPSINKSSSLLKKNKEIYFVGRLNRSKGYDLFKDCINKILNRYPNWKAFSIGDEKRRTLYINHKNHSELGFLNHKDVIQRLKKAEIVVIPSRWEEPFGRTALEAAACGCATITSDRGGLPETSDHHFMIKNLDSNNLHKAIVNLINNPNFRKKIQRDNYKNVKHLININTKLIDKIREETQVEFKINYLKNKLKIINIYNTGQKNNHRLFNISLGKKFTNGLIRNGHDVLEISDRDYIRQNRNLLSSGNSKFQQYLTETFKNYNPNLIFFGHTTNINIETFENFKNLNKNLIISQWNEDPVMKNLDYAKKNITNIKNYIDIVDHTFLTTHPEILKKNSNYINKFKNIHFFFVPVDPNIEYFSVYNLNPRNDIFYAMSHGVNRGTLKSGKIDERITFLDKLTKKLQNIKYDFYGFKNQEPIWGIDFYKALINSKMALNLSRGQPTKYYSSNRIASIMGNGLLTFIDKKTHIQDFFSKDEIVYYENIDDLSDKIKFFSKNDKLRIKIARNGQKKYFKLFNEMKTAQYIVNVSLGKKTNFI